MLLNWYAFVSHFRLLRTKYHHRITEPLLLEKTSRVTTCNHQPIPTVPIPQCQIHTVMEHSRDGDFPDFPWPACATALPLFWRKNFSLCPTPNSPGATWHHSYFLEQAQTVHSWIILWSFSWGKSLCRHTSMIYLHDRNYPHSKMAWIDAVVVIRKGWIVGEAELHFGMPVQLEFTSAELRCRDS